MASLGVPDYIRSLDLSREDEQPDLGWLKDSYAEPEAFWSGLFRHVQDAGPAMRGRPGGPQDIYYDSVQRHAFSGRPAYMWSERGDLLSISFADLDARASSVAALWMDRGVQPGSCLALVLPLAGPKLAVGMAAAFRLGACVSILAPAGPEATLHRLEALDPAHVLCETDTTALPDPFAGRTLPFEETRPPLRTAAYTYAADEPCGRILSPLRQPPLVPIDLPASQAVENGLRDALFATRVAPGDVLAAPGFPIAQHLPALLLSTWLAGAAFFDLAPAQIAAHPKLLADGPVTALGVAPFLEQRLRLNPLRLPRVRHVFRSVDESLDWSSFTEFLRKNGLARALSSNLLFDAAAGGCLLISTRRPGSASARVLAAPGRPYSLVDTVGTGEPAAGASGVFVTLGTKKPSEEGFFIVAERGAEMLYGGTVYPRRAGRVYPADEVVRFVGGLPGVAGASVVPLPTGDPGGRWAFHLLVFSGPLDSHRSPNVAWLEERIRLSLGEEFLPDRCSVFPLLPRRANQAIDPAWCQRQYLSGLLASKSRHAAFLHLTALRAALGVGAPP